MVVVPLKRRGILQKLFAAVGQFQGDMPDEQLAAQLLFQGCDAGAQGLLGDEQFLRRLRETAFSRDLQEILDALEIHGAPLKSEALYGF